jgi:DNA primase
MSMDIKQTTEGMIRRKFRKCRNLQGRPLREALQSAYEAEALLRRACQNDEQAAISVTERILELVSQHQQKVAASSIPPYPKHTPPTPPNQLNPMRKRKILEMTLKPREKAIRSAKIRARPPRMGVTNGLPVLKRPGRKPPLWVSLIINEKIKRKVRQLDALQHVQNNVLYHAEMEDEWDAAMRRAGSREELDGGSWLEGAQLFQRVLEENYRATELRTYAITQRFQKIIDEATIRYRERLRAQRIQRRAKEKEKLTKQMEHEIGALKGEWRRIKKSRSVDR